VAAAAVAVVDAALFELVSLERGVQAPARALEMGEAMLQV
jgi:hypothetical protein